MAEQHGRVAPFVALAVAVVVAALFVVLASSDTSGSDKIDSALIGRPAPRVISTTLDDEPFDLSRRKGSWVVLNFFDPECVPCVQEHPELVTFAADQAGVADGAELYTIISRRGVDDDVRAFFVERGGEWPIVRDPLGSINVSFGVSKVPETWIIDPDGVVQIRFGGPVVASDVSAVLQQLREIRAAELVGPS